MYCRLEEADDVKQQLFSDDEQGSDSGDDDVFGGEALVKKPTSEKHRFASNTNL